MAGGEVALLLFLFALGVAGVGVGINRLDRNAERRKARQRGKENRRRAAIAATMHCLECGSSVDPEQGAIYDHGAWWCAEDWKKNFQPEE